MRIPLAALPGFDPVGLFVRGLINDDGRYLVSGVSPCDPVAILVDGRESRGYRTVSFELVDLDVADSSTADRLARWLAARVGLEVGCTAPGWKGQDDGWVLTTFGKGVFFGAMPSNSRPAGHISIVPGLAGIDVPGGYRRLPDGSLFRDRLALAVVAVHVGSRP